MSITFHDYFDTWTPEMAYILGFTFADGCVAKMRSDGEVNTLIFVQNDEKLLTKIKAAMGVPHSVRPMRNSWRLAIVSDDICQALMSLGCAPAKSNDLSMTPLDVPEEFQSHFFRGFFDGDGCISFNTNGTTDKRYPAFDVCSKSRVFLEKIFKWTPVEPKTYIRKDGLWTFRVRRIKDVQRITEWMYADAGDLFLKRKRDKLMLLEKVEI